MKLTITITKGEEFFVSAIKEIPAVLSQGVTIEEAKANVLDALQLYLENIEH
jgi:predicted RNase H-like HicB family nuclease